MKMKLQLLGFLLIGAVHAAPNHDFMDLEGIVAEVNNANTTWKAGHNFALDTPLSHFKNIMGVIKRTETKRLPNMEHEEANLPDSFDARERWSMCPTISSILDQGNCGSCWAVAASSAYSDRLCIATGGKFKKPLSVEDLLSCCSECGYGCNGGSPDDAWNYFVEVGVVTGGGYDSEEGCQPYTIQPCEHHINGSRPQCSKLPTPSTPECHKKCEVKKNHIIFSHDIHKVKQAYSLPTVNDIQIDIMKYGSVEAAFDVYSDFVTYKSGVYQHVTGGYLGGHAVRVIGWGTENGTPYWLVANSWNYDWGAKGLFKILRGADECGFESDVVAGLA